MIIYRTKGASGIGLSIIFGTMLFCSQKKSQRTIGYQKNLQQVYEEATKKFEQDLSDSNLNTLNEAKEILESDYEEKTRGVIIRTMARAWREKRKIFSKFRKA